MTDYYATLGVPRTANADEIKQAFRRLASQHHPDKGGDTQKFQAIQEAYATLGDEQKRAEYGTMLHIEAPKVKCWIQHAERSTAQYCRPASATHAVRGRPLSACLSGPVPAHGLGCRARCHRQN